MQARFSKTAILFASISLTNAAVAENPAVIEDHSLNRAMDNAIPRPLSPAEGVRAAQELTPPADIPPRPTAEESGSPGGSPPKKFHKPAEASKPDMCAALAQAGSEDGYVAKLEAKLAEAEKGWRNYMELFRKSSELLQKTRDNCREAWKQSTIVSDNVAVLKKENFELKETNKRLAEQITALSAAEKQEAKLLCPSPPLPDLCLRKITVIDEIPLPVVPAHRILPMTATRSKDMIQVKADSHDCVADDFGFTLLEDYRPRSPSAARYPRMIR